MTAQTTAPSPSAPAASVLVIVEGPDDKNILSEIFNRKNISGIRIIESEGIGKIPQIIRQEYRNHDRILIVIDSDRDSPEVKAKDMYHKIWEVLNSEGFSEKLSTNLFYILESKDGGLLYITIYPLSTKDYDLSALCDGTLNHLFQSWPSELMSLLIPAILDQSTLEYLINQGVLGSNKITKSLIHKKFCEIMNLLCQQNFPIPSVKFPIGLIGNLSGIYGSHGVIGTYIIRGMDKNLFEKQFGGLIWIVQKMQDATKESSSS
jgi:hypothetical protein